MKVFELIRELSRASPTAEVTFATSDGAVDLLSIYSKEQPVGGEDDPFSDIHIDSKQVFIDVGDADE